MKIEHTFKTQAEKLDALFKKLADQDAGHEVVSGESYTKKVQGMNGQSQSVTLTVKDLEPGRYCVQFDGANGTTEASYTYEQISPEEVQLVYEETASGSGMISNLNQKLGAALFSHTAKKQMKRRIEMLERLLAEEETNS